MNPSADNIRDEILDIIDRHGYFSLDVLEAHFRDQAISMVITLKDVCRYKLGYSHDDIRHEGLDDIMIHYIEWAFKDAVGQAYNSGDVRNQGGKVRRFAGSLGFYSEGQFAVCVVDYITPIVKAEIDHWLGVMQYVVIAPPAEDTRRFL